MTHDNRILDVAEHWPFWQMGYPAIMVMDTALYRDPHYYQIDDRPEIWITIGLHGLHLV